MVSTFATHRDSLRETLFLLHAPQRRSTAPATASAEMGKQGGVRKKYLSCGTVREVRPNPSLKRTPNGLARRPGWAGASPHFAQPGRRTKPLVAA